MHTLASSQLAVYRQSAMHSSPWLSSKGFPSCHEKSLKSIIPSPAERIYALRSELAAVAKDRDSIRRQVQQLLGGQAR